MYKNATKHRHHHEDYDISADLEKIKSALFDTAKNMQDKAKDVLQTSVDNVKERSADAQESVADYILDKPIKSVGIALLAGVALGFLLRGRSRRK